MPESFYVPGEKRAEKVQDLFGAIARRYDLINDLQSFWLHRYWKRKMVSLARVKPGERALDVCCGTGDIAFVLNSAGAKVAGIDFSEPMLCVAEARNVSNVVFTHGDALHLPFPENSFEIVTIGYGLRNLSDFQGGLRELLRVLKPGGRLLILDFGKPDNRVWRAVYFAYLRLFVPIFGRIFCGNSATHAYILESLVHYPGQRGVAKLLSELNCKNLQTVNLLGGVMSINYAEKSE